MEQLTPMKTLALEQNKASSLYSTDSMKKQAESMYADSTTSTSSRPISIATPSYMNATVPVRKPVTPKLTTAKTNGHSAGTQHTELPSTFSPPSSATSARKGLLLLAIAALPHPSTIAYLEMMLKRGSYSGIVMIGDANYHAELKQLKMDIYALLGKMSLEVGVQLEPQGSWSHADITAATSKAVGMSGDYVHGALCCPSYGITSEDILDLEEGQFERSWKTSVAFLHGVAKAALPDVSSNGGLLRGMAGYFLIASPTESAATTSVCRTACDSFVTLLAEQNTAVGLIIDYAENVLIPEPEPEPVKQNGKLHPAMRNAQRDSDGYDFTAGESPTKLWNMWALQEQLGGMD